MRTVLLAPALGALLQIIAASPAFSNSVPRDERFEYSQVHMGVRLRLVVYARNEAHATQACRAAFGRVAELEQVASDWRPTSEVMRLCARFDAPAALPLRVSPDLWRLLSVSRRASRATGGAFDASVGPMVQLWRASRKSQVLPALNELEHARHLVNWKRIELDERNQAVRLSPGMRLDLGGVAKGDAGDAALQVLARHGIKRALFEAGGDLVASGPPPGERGWKVKWPEGWTSLLVNAALSTSGDTVQWVEVGGRRYSHVVDPRTGLGVTARWMATVWAPDGATADALSTALVVAGPRGVEKVGKYFPRAWAWVRKAPEAS